MNRSSTNGLTELWRAGVSIWLDDLSREMMTSGRLARLIKEKHLVGVTTNPTIFAKAVADSEAYDEQVRQLAARGADTDTAVREITTTDVRDAADAFRDVHVTTGGVDGRVSIEVDPRLAQQTEQTGAQVLDLGKTVDRPNIFVKIPATREGLPAITRALGAGVCVNVTLIFSLDRYREVIEAYVSGGEASPGDLPYPPCSPQAATAARASPIAHRSSTTTGRTGTTTASSAPHREQDMTNTGKSATLTPELLVERTGL